MISLSVPTIGKQEKLALCEVIDSGWLTMGDRVDVFEKEFAALHGVTEAVAVNSCTAALHLALIALGIGPGDEVLVPSLTFVATVNSILYVGATPVFLDIESIHKPHISLEDAKDKLSEKTKAVIVMHYGGYLIDFHSWRHFADNNGLLLIEDAAHAPAVAGVGSLSDAAAFSFFSNKNMSTAEGGMIIVRDKIVSARLRRLRSHGMSTNTLTRHRGHAYSYDVTLLGYNYRMDELRAAIGMVQLSRLNKWNKKRIELSNFYRHYLSMHIPEVIIPFDENHQTAAHLMPILLPPVENRTKVMEILRKEGIQSSIHYPAIHLFSYFKEKYPDIVLRGTEDFCQRELTLPLHPALSESDVNHIVLTLKKILNSTS